MGTIGWIDLTVPDAEKVRDFYSQVVGWKPQAVAMGDYNDYAMAAPEGDKVVAGICHARGGNTDVPTQWLIYITVKDLDKSLSACKELGGKIIAGPKQMGDGARYCVIQDPVGAVAMLFMPA